MLKFIKYLLKKLLFKLPKRPVVYAEDVIYEADRVIILYQIVKNNFHYCMKNGLLKRKDVLEFKFMLDNTVNQNDYKHEKFENDAHEIYSKLKSKSISKKNMLKLNDYLQPYLTLETISQPQEVVRQYGYLTVVK